MEAHNDSVPGADQSIPPPREDRSHRLLLAIGFLAAAVIAALAFGAYRQPELLLNLMGLRYCG